jgi:hypothetical protein
MILRDIPYRENGISSFLLVASKHSVTQQTSKYLDSIRDLSW